MLVTARDFAQTLDLCERHGLACEAIGHHRGGRLAAKGARPAVALDGARCAGRAGGKIDVALGHGSNDVTVAAAAAAASRARRRSTTSGRRSSTRSTAGSRAPIVVPDAIPPERLRPTARPRPSCGRYPGLKEEYYLADFEPDPAVLGELGLDPASRPIAVVRTPPAVSLYHRFENPLFAQVLDRLRGEQTVVLPRTPEQRAELGGFIVPERAIDAQSLIAYADLVISAGGTMNREAVALGTPVWTTFEGRMGAVDEALIADGRLRRLERAEDVAAGKASAPSGERDAPRSRPCWPTCCCHRSAASRPPAARAPRITPMRRRIRSAAFPVHRHALPQVALDAGLVALSYFLAYRLRFDGGVPPRYEDLFSARSRSRSAAASPSSRCSGSTGTGCATRRSASTCRSRRPSRSAVFALVGYVAVVQPKLIFHRPRASCR